MALMTLAGTEFTGQAILDLLRRDAPHDFSDAELFMRAFKDDSWDIPANLYPKAIADLQVFSMPEEEGYVPIYVKKAIDCWMAAGK